MLKGICCAHPGVHVIFFSKYKNRLWAFPDSAINLCYMLLFGVLLQFLGGYTVLRIPPIVF